MPSGSFVLWDYDHYHKQYRLDDRLQQTLTAVKITDGQAVLLEDRVGGRVVRTRCRHLLLVQSLRVCRTVYCEHCSW